MYLLKDSTFHVEFKFNVEFKCTLRGINAPILTDSNALTLQTRTRVIFLSISILNSRQQEQCWFRSFCTKTSAMPQAKVT